MTSNPRSGVALVRALLFAAFVIASAPLPADGPATDNSQSLVDAARERTRHAVVYDGSYRQIDYPNGDVPAHIGVCTDVLIRAYRSLGIDLQEQVHRDMQANFDRYPALWGLSRPDPNIDHRRVPNLEVFFQRHGEVLPLSQQGSDYQPGDIVSWRLPNGRPHIGILVDRYSPDSDRPWVVHNIGWGPQMEDVLFDYEVVGHFRYLGEVASR